MTTTKHRKNKPIFDYKYLMSKNHWQIYNWNSAEEDKSGDSETLPVESVPKEILRVAQKAASLIGDGLYELLIDSMIRRIELAKNILKINLIKDH